MILRTPKFSDIFGGEDFYTQRRSATTNPVLRGEDLERRNYEGGPFKPHKKMIPRRELFREEQLGGGGISTVGIQVAARSASARVFSIIGDMARLVMPDGQWIEVPLSKLPKDIKPGAMVHIDKGSGDTMDFAEIDSAPEAVPEQSHMASEGGPPPAPAVREPPSVRDIRRAKASPAAGANAARYGPGQVADYAGQYEGYSGTGGYNLTDRERDLVIRTIAGEAAGQPFEGQQAVANVILNRTMSGRFGASIEEVLFAPSQFEPWMTRKQELLGLRPEQEAYQRAAEALMAAEQADVTGGATHFLNPDIVRQRRGGSLPKWASGEPVAVIGQHNFYIPEGGGPTGMGQKAIEAVTTEPAFPRRWPDYTGSTVAPPFVGASPAVGPVAFSQPLMKSPREAQEVGMAPTPYDPLSSIQTPTFGQVVGAPNVPRARPNVLPLPPPLPWAQKYPYGDRSYFWNRK